MGRAVVQARQAFENDDPIQIDCVNPLYFKLLELAVSATQGEILQLIKQGIKGEERPLIAQFIKYDEVHNQHITTGTVDLGHLTRKGWKFPEIVQTCGHCPAMKLTADIRGLISVVIYGR